MKLLKFIVRPHWNAVSMLKPWISRHAGTLGLLLLLQPAAELLRLGVLLGMGQCFAWQLGYESLRAGWVSRLLGLSGVSGSWIWAGMAGLIGLAAFARWGAGALKARLEADLAHWLRMQHSRQLPAAASRSLLRRLSGNAGIARQYLFRGWLALAANGAVILAAGAWLLAVSPWLTGVYAAACAAGLGLAALAGRWLRRLARPMHREQLRLQQLAAMQVDGADATRLLDRERAERSRFRRRSEQYQIWRTRYDRARAAIRTGAQGWAWGAALLLLAASGAAPAAERAAALPMLMLAWGLNPVLRAWLRAPAYLRLGARTRIHPQPRTAAQPMPPSAQDLPAEAYPAPLVLLPPGWTPRRVEQALIGGEPLPPGLVPAQRTLSMVSELLPLVGETALEAVSRSRGPEARAAAADLLSVLQQDLPAALRVSPDSRLHRLHAQQRQLLYWVRALLGRGELLAVLTDPELLAPPVQRQLACLLRARQQPVLRFAAAYAGHADPHALQQAKASLNGPAPEN